MALVRLRDEEWRKVYRILVKYYNILESHMESFVKLQNIGCTEYRLIGKEIRFWNNINKLYVTSDVNEDVNAINVELKQFYNVMMSGTVAVKSGVAMRKKK